MRRIAHVVLCLVLFAAAMEGFVFLAGSGVSREFGVGFVFGAALAFAMIVTLTDRDYSGPFPSLVLVGFALMTCGTWGYHLGLLGAGFDLLVGPLVGFGLMFPILYWTTGMDRAKNGFPRPPLSRPWSRRNGASQPY